MASIDLSDLNIDQLTDLVGKAQSEMASREKQRRKDLRSELERRVAADGYKLGDIFPELGTGATGGRQRRKMPVKVPEPAEPRRDLDRDRAVAEVGAGDPRRAADRHGVVQDDSDVPGSHVGHDFQTALSIRTSSLTAGMVVLDFTKSLRNYDQWLTDEENNGYVRQ